MHIELLYSTARCGLVQEYWPCRRLVGLLRRRHERRRSGGVCAYRYSLHLKGPEVVVTERQAASP